ncbi:hypothetical protein EW146_g2988 [Bondarzewia mesenterica]|uniref:C2H2-type domain-containing protein n=1 Tax=Bondarzewia mesenterica TaxID=1095465 RepID=A0A4S4LZE1_9AGAM|nr:hypothetical protein EW146_g2988 [Bondarzewia mesenterica]
MLNRFISTHQQAISTSYRNPLPSLLALTSTTPMSFPFSTPSYEDAIVYLRWKTSRKSNLTHDTPRKEISSYSTLTNAFGNEDPSAIVVSTPATPTEPVAIPDQDPLVAAEPPMHVPESIAASPAYSPESSIPTASTIGPALSTTAPLFTDVTYIYTSPAPSSVPFSHTGSPSSSHVPPRFKTPAHTCAHPHNSIPSARTTPGLAPSVYAPTFTAASLGSAARAPTFMDPISVPFHNAPATMKRPEFTSSQTIASTSHSTATRMYPSHHMAEAPIRPVPRPQPGHLPTPIGVRRKNGQEPGSMAMTTKSNIISPRAKGKPSAISGGEIEGGWHAVSQEAASKAPIQHYKISRRCVFGGDIPQVTRHPRTIAQRVQGLTSQLPTAKPRRILPRPSTQAPAPAGPSSSTPETADEYRCEKCNKGFSGERQLERHMRLTKNHNPERPWKCRVTVVPECGKDFVRKDNRDKHEQLHFRGMEGAWWAFVRSSEGDVEAEGEVTRTDGGR